MEKFDNVDTRTEDSLASSSASPEIDVDDHPSAARISPHTSPIPGNATYPKMPFRPFASAPVPVEPRPLAAGGFFNPFVDPKSLVEAYAARLHSEADYAR
jgi:hypothetical protein